MASSRGRFSSRRPYGHGKAIGLGLLYTKSDWARGFFIMTKVAFLTNDVQHPFLPQGRILSKNRALRSLLHFFIRSFLSTNLVVAGQHRKHLLSPAFTQPSRRPYGCEKVMPSSHIWDDRTRTPGLNVGFQTCENPLYLGVASRTLQWPGSIGNESKGTRLFSSSQKTLLLRCAPVRFVTTSMNKNRSCFQKYTIPHEPHPVRGAYDTSSLHDSPSMIPNEKKRFSQ
jgi:hypothetical protein